MNLAHKHSRHSGWPEALQSLVGTVTIALFVVTFIVQAFQIPSESMENTLLIGDYLLVDKLHFGGNGLAGLFLPYRKVKRGDIIVFHYPVHPSEHFVKRVVGLPGDRIRLVHRKVYVNGAPIEEPYVHFSRPHDGGSDSLFRDDFPRLDRPVAGLNSNWWREMQNLVDDGELIVPAGNYFVMGDNRDDSLDSRYWGFVPAKNIVGRPLVIYWSMRSQQAQGSGAERLGRFVYALSHLIQITRWDRALRIVQ